MPRKPRTLLWQLAAALMIVQAVVALAFGWYGYARLLRFHHEQALSELQRFTPLVASRCADVLDEHSAKELAQRVGSDGAASGIRITVIAPDGRVLADSQADVAGMDNHAGRPEVIDALAHGHGSEVRFSHTLNANLLYYAQTLVENGQVKAVIRTAKPMTAVDHELDRLLGGLGLAGLLSLAVTFAVILLVSRRVSGSVWSIADSARRFASGDWSHRIAISSASPASSSRELAVLADSLNSVADQLATHIGQLQAQRNEQQAIVQSMSSGVMALDRQQRILSLNRAAERMLGLSGSLVRGRLLQEALRQPALNQFVASAMESPSGTTAEFALDGAAQAVIQATSQPLQDARDRPVGLLVLLSDVTELRRLENIRSEFVANVSHELRTPITNIKGYIETMLQVGVEDRQQSRKFLEIIARSADRLAAIIDDLLALARLEQPDSRAALELEVIPVKRIAAAAIAQHSTEARNRKITIVTDMPDDLPVKANSQLMEQALGNLISNAVKYSAGGTMVTVSARARPSDAAQVEIAVVDEGPGIDARDLPRIFERFYRVDKARSRELGGTGLGLSIVKHIALAHGGSVEVDSELGKGSVFRLIVPRG